MATTHTLLLITLHLFLCKATPSVPRLRLPHSCVGKGFCFEKHALYPQDIIDNLALKWNMSVVKNKPPLVSQNDVTTSSHLLEGDDCARDRRMDPIYEIVDAEGNIRVVMQSEQNIKQLIEVEQCLNPGRIVTPSLHFNQLTVDHNDLRCLEHNIDVYFLVLNLNWTDFEMVKTKSGVPVACYCRFTSNN